MVAFGQDDGNFLAREPGAEFLQNGGREAVGGVDEVARDDEFARIVAFDELAEAVEVVCGVAFGHGNSARAEGGGFPEMDVGHDEGARFG